MNAINRQTVVVQVIAVVVAITGAWLLSRFALYPWLGIPDYAPMILRPIAGFSMAWLVLWLASERWADYGLAKPHGPLHLVLTAVGLYIAVFAVNRFAVPAIAEWLQFTGGPSIFGYIRGNGVALVGWLAVSWVVGAWCEELLFRGFLLNKLSRLAGEGWLAVAVGVIAQAVLFGLLHLYQGPFGFVFAFVSACVFGLGYVVSGRNLWPLIIVHGVWNSVGIYGIYTS